MEVSEFGGLGFQVNPLVSRQAGCQARVGSQGFAVLLGLEPVLLDLTDEEAGRSETGPTDRALGLFLYREMANLLAS